MPPLPSADRSRYLPCSRTTCGRWLIGASGPGPAGSEVVGLVVEVEAAAIKVKTGVTARVRHFAQRLVVQPGTLIGLLRLLRPRPGRRCSGRVLLAALPD